MKDLLLKWIALETESRIQLDDPIIQLRISENRAHVIHKDLGPEEFTPELMATIQLGVQEAIFSKDWYFRVYPTKNWRQEGTSDWIAFTKTHYVAEVIAPTEGIVRVSVGLETSVAESLLSAYLKALEAVEAEEAA